MISRLLAAAILLAGASPVAAQADEQALSVEPVTIGETLTLKSAIMNQQRRISVYLPSGYATSDKSYPILYLIDGGTEQDYLHIAGTTLLNALWGRSREVIVIGVETQDRRAELIGETASTSLREEYPTAGHSAQFRRFIRDEVMPLAQARYRGNGTRGVIGESLAGLFIVEAALEEPDLFQHHAAISPSLWWDDERLSRRAADLLAKQHGGPNLYLTIANEGGEMQVGYDRLVDALGSQAPASSDGWCAIPRADLTHGTIYHAMSPQALQFLFPAPPSDYEIEGFEPPCASSAD